MRRQRCRDRRVANPDDIACRGAAKGHTGDTGKIDAGEGDRVTPRRQAEYGADRCKGWCRLIGVE